MSVEVVTNALGVSSGGIDVVEGEQRMTPAGICQSRWEVRLGRDMSWAVGSLWPTWKSSDLVDSGP